MREIAILRRLSQVRHLRTRLTVLYAGLFGVILILLSGSVFTAISGAAQRQVRGELSASATVFDQVWALKSEQLRQGAQLLSRDFGFREAVATHDSATVTSAVENLRARLGIDLAFMVGADGAVIGAQADRLDPHADTLVNALYASEAPHGVMQIAGVPYQLVASPIMAPDLIGWVVFGARLDGAQLNSLEKLAAIRLDSAVAHKIGADWSIGRSLPPRTQAALNAHIADALSQEADAPRTLNLQGVEAFAMVKPLQSLDSASGSALLLTYPVARAYAPYRPLLATIGLIGGLGLVLVVLGSWSLARGVTRPITALDQAARRLSRGEEVHVTAEGQDEIGRLAESFNQMATEIRERERRITHLALHDPETGLSNRLALEQAVEGLQGPLFVAALGVERFAHVRGAIGYGLAAQVIQEVGERLAGLQPKGAVARLSTAVLGLAFQATDADEAERLMERLLADLEHPVHVGGEAIDVALSVGLSPMETEAGLAVERATIGLDQARAARRKIAVFDAEAYGDPASNLSLMSGMLRAIEDGHVELFYQPKFDLRRRGVHAVEGLVRWRHPVRGMLRPDLFIPMAEETGHIRALTDWCLRQAIVDQKLMAEAGHEIEVAINVSGRLLGDPEFADLVEILAPQACGKLIFEITETAVIENPDLALTILDRFKAAGVDISIDDFGSGLSSLAYLKQIRGHELKIDRSLVVDLTQSQRDALIVRSTIDLAHSLGLKVTAEGIEEPAAFQLLAAMGCDQIQGYLIGKPQTLTDLMDFLRNDRAELKRVG
ncbi:MAG TPA: EAL domain-containing protein [Phenylobacterium sp.]|nr:EAL domain-containing protein [Phenylobacterium sp.]